MRELFIDIETYNETPITHGTGAYAETVEVMLFTYGVDDQPFKLWDATVDPTPPADLVEAMRNAEVVIAHNAAFERSCIKAALPGLLPDEGRWRCSMACALAHSLPGSLDMLARVLGLPEDKQKDKEGKRLIHLFCKPLPKNNKLDRATRHTHPAEWEAFKSYCAQDGEAARAVWRKLPKHNYSGFELRTWQIDQRVNERGFLIDMPLVRGALSAVGQAQRTLATQAAEMTDGAVEAATQRDKLLEHITQTYGIKLADMRKDTLEKLLAADSTPPELRALLDVRLQSSSVSTAKYKALERSVCSDDALRWTIQWCGASRTGRDAGRLFQPQNLPRYNTKAIADWWGVEPRQLSDAQIDGYLDTGIAALRTGCADLLFDDIMRLASNAIRGVIIARPGKRLVVADLANIEGRVAAWLGREDWKLQAFRDFDAGTGPDLYKLAYGRAFGLDPNDVPKDGRQIGKVMELMLQYEGGVGAFITGAATYGIDLNKMAEAVLNGGAVPATVLADAQRFLEWCEESGRPTFDLTREAFIACDVLKRLWRHTHPGITGLWADLGTAVRLAIESGKESRVGRLAVGYGNGWLQITLPSGRSLCYPGARFDEQGFSYMGTNQYTRKWERIRSYSGKVMENLTQAVARDVLKANIELIEDEGYQILLPVHDELVTESARGDDETLSRLMTAPIPWADGLPLAAKGFTAQRYKKD